VTEKSKARAPVAGALSVGAFHEEEALGQTYDWRLLKRMYPWVRPHALLLGGALLLMPVASLVSLAQPYLIKLAIDATLVERSAAALREVVVLFVAALLAEFVTRFGQTYLMQLAGQRTMAGLRRATFRHVQRLRVGYFDRTPVGRVVTRVTNDVDSLSEFFASGAVTAIADVVTLVGIVAFMLYLDWQLSLVAFAALPPLAVLVNLFRRFAREAFRDIRARIAQLNAYLAEQVQGVAVVQAFGREERCAREYEQINAGYRDANYRAIKYDALLYSVVESISVASVAVILWYASTEAGLVGDPDAAAAYIGTVVAFYEYIQRFFIPIRDLATKYTIIQQSLAAAERIFGLLDVDEIDAQAAAEPRPAQPAGEAPALSFDAVTFGYRPGHPVLEDVTLDVRQGEMVAIVGATGSGKTTLTSLLLRLYELETGTIRLGGVDVRSLDRHDLRRRFAVVPQDVFLFSGTVLENVALGADSASSADAERARDVLQRAGAWELLERRGGLDARVDERGQNFSAGERQLLALARALYTDPPFLMLDEATANIDSETEARLQLAVSEVVRGRTSLVIAHRLSTIRNADRIVVLHRGRVVEEGTHDALLASHGVYARLHRLHTT
jgi:ATP-binding cassette subfamily B protein